MSVFASRRNSQERGWGGAARRGREDLCAARFQVSAEVSESHPRRWPAPSPPPALRASPLALTSLLLTSVSRYDRGAHSVLSEPRNNVFCPSVLCPGHTHPLSLLRGDSAGPVSYPPAPPGRTVRHPSPCIPGRRGLPCPTSSLPQCPARRAGIAPQTPRGCPGSTGTERSPSAPGPVLLSVLSAMENGTGIKLTVQKHRHHRRSFPPPPPPPANQIRQQIVCLVSCILNMFWKHLLPPACTAPTCSTRFSGRPRHSGQGQLLLLVCAGFLSQRGLLSHLPPQPHRLRDVSPLSLAP